jgi:carboxyl-terminal processing protease
VRVEPDSPAAKANVGTGWEVLEVDAKSIASTLSAAADSFWNKPTLPMVQHRIALNWLSGFPGEATSVTFRDGAGERRTLEMSYNRPAGEPFRMGVFPPTYVTIDSRILEGNVGYFAFSLFMDPVRLMKSYETSIERFRDCRGIILDIRGNGGGLPAVAMGMAGWLSNEKQQFLGTMVTRETELRFVVNPRLRPYFGPVAVLIDGSSASAAEIFAAGLRDMGRARLFGTRTAGAVLPAHFKRLANGDFLYHPIADYVSADGSRLEGVGVSPDEWAPHTRESLLEGRDNALNAAWNWIVRNGGSMPAKGETS